MQGMSSAGESMVMCPLPNKVSGLVGKGDSDQITQALLI